MVNILIIDYGMGNLRSVEKAFFRLGITPKISSCHHDILNADKLILPGVGHFKNGMLNLRGMGLIGPLNEAVLIRKIPILGICLGMQLMTEFSEEGNCEGLKWIKAKTVKFSFNSMKLKIPHIGWNRLNLLRGNDLLKNINSNDLFYFIHSYYVKCENKNDILKNINSNDLFYFIHSYYVKCENKNDILTTTYYGIDFVSSFNNQNIFGCQFHPEKSHSKGLEILKKFINL